MNKTEQETHFSEETIKFRPYIYIKDIIIIDDYLYYKESKNHYNFFLVLIFNELFKFKTSVEWQH